MPDQLQLRGGTTSEHNSFTGALREVTVDTTKKTLVVHDGSQAGGTPLMKESGTVDPTTITIGTGGTQRLAISNSEVVFNDTSADVDFRVESDTNTHALFLNAGNSRIGVNQSAPNYALDVDGDIGCQTVRILGATPGIRFTDTADTGGYGHVGVNNNSGSLVMRSDDGNALSNSYMGFEVDGGTKMYITSTGNVGIGLTNPSYKLEVSGNCQIITPTNGLQFPFVVRNDYTPDSDRSDLAFLGNLTSNNTLRIGTIASNGGITLQGVRQNDSAQKVSLILNPDGGKVGIGTASPSQLFHVNGQARVTSLGVGEDAGSATIGVNGNISINPSGNTSFQKFNIKGSQVTTGSALTIGNYGDVEGDYYFIGVNATLNSSGSNIKTNDAKRHAGLYLDGRMGSVMLTSSQTSTSTINNHYTFDRNGNFTLAGNVVLATSGAGIDFSATSDASGKTSELLDDYEEGTWTPTIGVVGGSFTTSPTISVSAARYTKIGRQVFVEVYMQFGNDGAIGAGGAYPVLSGLPYTCNSSVTYPSVSYGWYDFSSSLMNEHEVLTGYVQNGNDYIVFYKVANNGNNGVLNANTFANNQGGNFQLNCAYTIA